MTSQFDFSNHDWNTVASAPVLVGMAVAKAEDSGYFGSRREARTLDGQLESGAEGNPARTLIDQAAATEPTPEVDAAMALPPSALADAAVAACVELTALLSATTKPDEAKGYKIWVLNVANEVAAAATENGVRVSDGEAALIDRIRVALELA